MKILGYEIKKAVSEKPSTKAEIRNASPQGPMTAMFQDLVLRKVSGDFYEMLREGIPIIDSAIRRLISFNGTIKIIGDKTDCVAELEDFCLNVPVNDTQQGIHAFLENASNETFEQGFSLSEFVATPDLKDIAGLKVADSKDIVYRKNTEGKAEPWYRNPSNKPVLCNSMPGTLIDRILNASYNQSISINGVNEIKLNPENKIYFSINNENSNPYGASIMRSMEFCSQILVTLQNSIKNVGERFGDPMYHAHLKTKTNDLDSRRQKLEDDFKIIVNAKRQGKSGDIVTAGGPDSDVSIKVIGHEGQILTYDSPLRHVLEQIVSKTNIPAWLLGIYWSTTERMATLEVESALQDAKIRQLVMFPQFIKLFSIYLMLRGKKFKTITTSLDKPGDWGIIFETPNLRDIVAQAQARFLNAQADMMGTVGAASPQTTLNVGAASVVEIQGMKFPLITAKKSCTKESRPRMWPELDKVEADYESELKYDWEELRQKVFTILKLNQKKVSRTTKEDTSFVFSEEQRSAIMQALKSYLGYYEWDNPDSAVRWSYGQAYSLGLIQAAQLLNKNRPILDIIKNKEIFDELCQSGFQLLKDNATQAIVDDIIPEIEAQMLAGTNPVNVAERLNKLFGDQNSDWERLARSEMSMAAEKAKLDEWKEWDVQKVEFTPAPDACAICFALAGDYDIGSCPIPVDDTHPNCRCSTRPAESESART